MADAKLTKILDEIGGLTVLEVSALIKMMEEKFDVKAAAGGPMMMAMAPGAAVVEEEKTEFDVILTDFGEKKINVIKEVRALTGLGLKEAKDLVDSLPKPVKEAVSKDEAAKVKKQLEEAGAKVEVK